MEFIPMYVDESQNKEPGDIIKNTDWNNLFNLLMTQGNHNTDALLEITQTYPTTVQMDLAIAERVAEIGAGDMAKAVYDTNEDGVVDLAETVVDDGITTPKILDGAVTENKLSEFLLQYIQTAYTTAMDKSRVKFGKISDLTPSSTEQGATTDKIPVNKYKTYNIGFTPSILIIFSVEITRGSTSSARVLSPSFMKYYDGTYNQYYFHGGVAYPNNIICNGFPIEQSSEEIFRIVSNGFRTHEYDKHNSSDYTILNIDFSDSYYLAIG